MADNSTGLAVKSLAGEFILSKLVDSGGSNVAAVSAAGRVSVDASGIAVPVTDNAGSLTVDNAGTFAVQDSDKLADNAAFTDGTTKVFTAGYIFDEVAGTALTENDVAAARIDSKRAVVGVIEDATTRSQRASVSAGGGLHINLAQIGANTVVTGGVNGTLAVGGVIAHDGAAAAALPVGIGAFASAAAPADVSADGDAVKIWALRNGSQVANLASGGTLITIGQKTMANSLPVVLASDQSAVAENITQIAGSAPSATNPLPVRLADGAAFYNAGSAAPVSPILNTVTSAALAAAGNANLETADITTGKTGRLAGIDIASTVPLKFIISTTSGGTPTTRSVGFALAAFPVFWRPPFQTYITQAGGANNRFRVNLTNKDPNTAADVYATFYHDEV